MSICQYWLKTALKIILWDGTGKLLTKAQRMSFSLRGFLPGHFLGEDEANYQKNA